MCGEGVAFVGLGAMGSGMAMNLAKALAARDQTLHVYNRTASKAEAFAAQHQCTACSSLSDVCRACSVVCLMLADDAACGATLDELAALGLQGKTIVNHSTASPDFGTHAQQQVAAAGGTYVASPVFGRPDAAAGARLVVLAAGPDDALQRCMPCLSAHGPRVIRLGQDVARASALKLCGNLMIFGIVDMLSEAFVLAEKNGVERQHLLDVVDAFFPAPSIQGYARRIAAGGEFDATAGASVELALKDVRYIRRLADAAQVPLPMADVVFSHLLSAAANGHGSKDVSALSLAVLQEAGLRRA